MTREPDDDRRTVLKLAGLSAAGVGSIAGLSGTAAASNSEDGLITVEGGETVEGTVERIEAAIEEGPPELITTFNHAANAASVDEELRETTLILFGTPEVGTPIMQENQTAGIDLPQKLLVWCDEDGQVQITYNDPEWNLVDRHSVSESEQIEMMSEALAGFAAAGAEE
ncbi:DUF302 domain-containing protein [Halalkalicoccus tibetensis]|uniref:DUF302 domain-containing protein n=1 Tax=Halalkalicoccus tibetensis TaxID=175632 RepID=A0ABD5VAW9_9EURY